MGIRVLEAIMIGCLAIAEGVIAVLFGLFVINKGKTAIIYFIAGVLIFCLALGIPILEMSASHILHPERRHGAIWLVYLILAQYLASFLIILVFSYRKQ